MAFTSGNATDQNDLLNKLRLYLVAHGWTQLAWSAGATTSDPSTLDVRGPGAGAGKEVFVSVRSQINVPNDVWCFEFRGAVAYSGALGWGAQVGQSPQQCYLNLWDGSIDYWFYVNDRRFIIVAKCSTNYMSAYCGFFLPWGTPAQYPFPLVISGDFYDQRSFSYANAARRMFVDPGNGGQSSPLASCYARSATGIWYPIGNHGNAANNNFAQGVTKGARGVMWPYHSGSSWGLGVGQYDPTYWSGGTGAGDAASALEALVPTQQGERALLPVMVTPTDQAPLGVLDAAYCVGGTGLATEQQLTLGARTFRVFQNIARNSPDDFFCVEEV